MLTVERQPVPEQGAQVSWSRQRCRSRDWDMSRARCVSPQNLLTLPRGVKPRLSRNATALPNYPLDTFDVRPQLPKKNSTERSSENVCADMYTPASTMDYEQYQDLSQLGWFDSAATPWSAAESPLTPHAQAATDHYSPLQATQTNLFNGERDYKINDMDNQLFIMTRTDSVEEMRSLVVTAPMEVVPMRHHETLEVSGLVKTENEEFDVGREEEITFGEETKTEPFMGKFEVDQEDMLLMMDTPDLLNELGSQDLIDYLTSDEPPQQPLVPSPGSVPLELPSPPMAHLEPLPPTKNIQSPAPMPPLETPKAKKGKSTYVAIPRQFTAGVNDTQKIPKMLILKTPPSPVLPSSSISTDIPTKPLQPSRMSTINFNDLQPAIVISERIKTEGSRKRSLPVFSDITDEEDSTSVDFEVENKADPDYGAENARRPVRTARRLSTTSISSASTDKYRELRNKNNEASRRSRLNRKHKEKEISSALEDGESRNKVLRTKYERLEKDVMAMRAFLLRLMVKCHNDKDHNHQER